MLRLPISTYVPAPSGTALLVTGTGATFSLPWTDFDSVVVGLSVASVGGTNPTLDLYVQTQGPDGNWYDMYHFPQQTANTTAGHQVFVALSCTGQRLIGDIGASTIAANTLGVGFLSNNLRFAYTVGGTATPTFTPTINFYGNNTDRPL